MFSIVIPLYNKEKSIEKTLQSVFNQTYKNYEIIIVDDGSTDTSVEKVEALKNEKIVLFRKKNGGSSSARNKGIELAKYNHIAFIDADDCWEPEYLSEQKRLIEDYPDAAMWGLAPGYIHHGKKELIDHVLPVGYRNYIEDFFGMKRKTDLFHTSSTIVPIQTFLNLGNFDIRIKGSEDTDLWFRIIATSKVVFYNKTYAYHNLDGENRIMTIRPKLKDHFSFYISKMNSLCSESENFFRFINEYAAIKNLYYYFETKGQRNDARDLIEKIEFRKIKFKYWLMYRTPFAIGWLVYQIVKFKKNNWKFNTNKSFRSKEGSPV